MIRWPIYSFTESGYEELTRIVKDIAARFAEWKTGVLARRRVQT